MASIQSQLISQIGSVSPPGMSPATNPFVSVLNIQSFEDFLLATLYIGIFYYLVYFLVGGKDIFS
jgi:hypothetical protein